MSENTLFFYLNSKSNTNKVHFPILVQFNMSGKEEKKDKKTKRQKEGKKKMLKREGCNVKQSSNF